jgi:hypothetical protein
VTKKNAWQTITRRLEVNSTRQRLRDVPHSHVASKYDLSIFLLLGGVGLSPLGTAATSDLLCQPQMIVEGDCGAIGGMKIGRGKPSTRRKLAPAPLCPPKISLDQTRDRTPAASD